MTYNVRNIAIALVMAIAAAAAVLVYTTSYRQSVTRGQKRVEVHGRVARHRRRDAGRGGCRRRWC